MSEGDARYAGRSRGIQHVGFGSRIDALMSGKTLNQENLSAIGADALAGLVLRLVEGDASLKRLARQELLAHADPAGLAANARKRFAAIRRAGGYLSESSESALARELFELAVLIETRLAPENPDDAFDLLWSMLQLWHGIYGRVDDYGGEEINHAMKSIIGVVGHLAPRVSTGSEFLAERVFETAVGFPGGGLTVAVKALGGTLGEAGLTRLKELSISLMDGELSEEEFSRFACPYSPKDKNKARNRRDDAAKTILKDIADVQGDVDAWIAVYGEYEMTSPGVAEGAARRLINANRAQEAFRIVEESVAKEGCFVSPELRILSFDCLEALGRIDELRETLWNHFERHLSVDSLRRLLKNLPDFEDEEALERARKHVLSYGRVHRALEFCIELPDLPLAARLVEARADELDGNRYEILTPSAEALEAEHPLAAVLIWRPMILFALEKKRTTRYRHAGRHFLSCADADARVENYGNHPDHAGFEKKLREEHGRKGGFWSLTKKTGSDRKKTRS